METECRSLWIRAMEFSPRLSAYCPHWGDFTPMEWATLIAGNSDFICIAPLHLLGADEWFVILNRQPALVDKCKILDCMMEKYGDYLSKQYPWLKKQ